MRKLTNIYKNNQEKLKQGQKSNCNQPQIDQNQVKYERFQDGLKFLQNCSQQNQQPCSKQSRVSKKKQKYIWTPEQQLLLLQLYKQYGPIWSTIAEKFIKKDQNCIKNKFNSYMRKAVKLLDNHERQVMKKMGRGVSIKIVSIILQITSQIRQKVIKRGMMIQKQSQLFTFRNNFVNFCFRINQASSEELTKLINSIKALNKKLRCFGAFKRKNVKGWRLSADNLDKICLFDKVCKDKPNNEASPDTQNINANQMNEQELLPQLQAQGIKQNNSKHTQQVVKTQKQLIIESEKQNYLNVADLQQYYEQWRRYQQFCLMQSYYSMMSMQAPIPMYYNNENRCYPQYLKTEVKVEECWEKKNQQGRQAIGKKCQHDRSSQL